MLQTLPTTQAIEANGGKLVLVPVSADEADDDSPYSAKMCPQPVDLILEGVSQMLPKRKRRRAMRRSRAARAIIIHATPRPRERRAAPRREGGARDGSSASGDDGGGSSDPPPRRKSEHGPRAEIRFTPSSSLCAPRVHEHGRAQQ